MKTKHLRHAIRSFTFASALLLLMCSAATAQQYKPTIEYQSLLNMRYYENNGGFLVEDLQLVFPPANIGNAKLVVAEQGVGAHEWGYTPAQASLQAEWRVARMSLGRARHWASVTRPPRSARESARASAVRA